MSQRLSQRQPLKVKNYYLIIYNFYLDGVIEFDYCHSTSFKKNDKKIALILLYVAAGWVGGWAILTIFVNMCFGFVCVNLNEFNNLFIEFGVIIEC